MKISIIMLVYNHERFLRDALESVLMQETEYDYELIVGEDCSTDSSREILKEYEERFGGRLKPIYRDKNIGMTRNVIDCAKKCSGEYIAMLEGDDKWLSPHKLQKMVTYLDEHPEMSACACNYEIRNQFDEFLYMGMDITEDYIFSLDNVLLTNIPAQTSTWVYRNYFDELFKYLKLRYLKYAWLPMDSVFSVFLLSKGNIQIFEEAMSVYHFYYEENGTNFTSRHVGEKKRMFFYFVYVYVEKVAREFGVDVKLDVLFLKFFKASTSNVAFSREGLMYLWHTFLIVLTVPRKKNFVKLVKANIGRDNEHLITEI